MEGWSAIEMMHALIMMIITTRKWRPRVEAGTALDGVDGRMAYCGMGDSSFILCANDGGARSTAVSPAGFLSHMLAPLLINNVTVGN
jgi:hypothetical protein